MESKKTVSAAPPGILKAANHGRIVATPAQNLCLDAVQLDRLEQSFRAWTENSKRMDVGLARRRMLIIFLLIRYTGAKLNEVLALNPIQDIDPEENRVVFRSAGAGKDANLREVRISGALSREIGAFLSDSSRKESFPEPFNIDPGFVRRRFYERAQACGFPKQLGGPEMIRKARGVELMQGNLPLPAVQKMLGHSTPNLTSAYVSFSADEIQQVTQRFIEREASRKTSARNAFFGKVQGIQGGDIQSRVTLTTLGGNTITTVITNDSLERLGLKQGLLITAEVKAPWVMLHSGGQEPRCSAENRFSGVVTQIKAGKVNTEYTVRIEDGTFLCAVFSTASARRLALGAGDRVWALFNCFAVILHVD